MKLVTIDMGNWQFKAKERTQIKFSSAFRQGLETNKEAFEYVDYNGVTTIIGNGKVELEYQKVNRVVEPQILYAIDKVTEETSVNLCLLLPIKQLTQREALIEQFQDKTFNYIVNGKEKEVHIGKVIVLPEGQTAYYSLENPNPYTLLMDVGSKTVNWACYRENKLEKNGTIKLGTIDLYKTIMDIENSKGEDYVLEDIPHQIKREIIDVDRSVYINFLKQILDEIKGERVNLKNYEPVFTGGGALVLKDVINAIPNAKVHNAPIFGSVLGAEKICNKMLKK